MKAFCRILRDPSAIDDFKAEMMAAYNSYKDWQDTLLMARNVIIRSEIFKYVVKKPQEIVSILRNPFNDISIPNALYKPIFYENISWMYVNEAYPCLRKYCLFQVLASDIYKANGFEKIGLFCIWAARRKYEQWPTILISILQGMLESFIKYNCYDIALKLNKDILEKYISIRSDKSLKLQPSIYIATLMQIVEKVRNEKDNPFTNAANHFLKNFGYVRIPNIEEDSIKLYLQQDKVYRLGPKNSIKPDSSNAYINEFNQNLSWLQLLKLIDLKAKNDAILSNVDDVIFADTSECFTLYQRKVREAFIGESLSLAVMATNYLPLKISISDVGIIMQYKDPKTPEPERKKVSLDIGKKSLLKAKSLLQNEGILYINGLEWKLADVVSIRLKFGEYTERISIDFTKLQIKVLPPTGLLKCKVTSMLKDEYYYGELSKIVFTLTNVGSETVNSICIGTNYPIFLNMEIMDIKKPLLKGESTTIELPFRAAITGNINLMILAHYSTTKERNLLLSHTFKVLPSIQVAASLLRNEMSFTEKVLLMKLSVPKAIDFKICSTEILDKSFSIQSRIPSSDPSMYYLILTEKETFSSQKLVLNEGFPEEDHYSSLISKEQISMKNCANDYFFALRWMCNNMPAISLFHVSPLQINHKLPLYMKLKHLFKVFHDFDSEPMCYVDVEVNVLNIDEAKDLSITVWLPSSNGLTWNTANPIVLNNIPPQV